MRDAYREHLDDILADLVQMSQNVSTAVRSSTTALLEADIHLAEQVISDDELLDADWPYGVEAAVDCALLGRSHGRIAGHPASMGRRIISVVPGEFPKSQVWPQP